MKFHGRIFALALIGAVALSFGACAKKDVPKWDGGDENGGEGNSQETVTKYEDIVTSPDYPEIEDSVYTTYYIDSESGSDSNTGLSENSPKASIAAANSIIASVKKTVPTKVLFKAGTEYGGAVLTVDKFAAEEETPLIVGVYGQTEEKPYAKIVGGNDANCVSVRRGNVRIGRLECTAPRGFRGIHVTTSEAGATKNIVIADCWCHDINFITEGIELPENNEMPDSQTVQQICGNDRFSYSCGGIIFETDTSPAKGPSWYENIWIENNRIERVARTGIWVFSNWAARPGVDWGTNHYYDDETNWFHHSNVNIRNNFLYRTGGDGIILGVTVGGFIEGNTSYYAQYLGRPNNYCAGIWSHSCKDLVFQFNEAAYTYTTRDGEGFDIDIGNSNILFQYNYAHHNEGGGLLCCNTKTAITLYDKEGNLIFDEDGLPKQEIRMADWQNVVIRNNVFADNLVADLQLSGTVNKVLFENNTVVKAGEVRNERIVFTKDFGTGVPGGDWTFRNNIFAMRKMNDIRMSMEFSTDGGYTFSNNVYYNFNEKFKADMLSFGVTDYVEKNPQFFSTEAGDGMEYAEKFYPTNEEMFRGAAKLPNALKYDFGGNDAEGILYYGAFAKKA